MEMRFYRDINTLHVGTKAPRAYFIPFSVGQNAFDERESSNRFIKLTGEWDFRWFANVEELELEQKDFSSTVICTDKMRVPFHWQLCLDRGYDAPNYINQDYPYPVDPPHLPDVIPCGFYRRKVTLCKKPDKDYTLIFEGVSAGFYVWINGGFTGYSQVSHCTSEFDITNDLVNGENTVEVLVVKHCTGSYMEDQDFFRLSGIFRDVYMLERDKTRIEDVQIKSEVSEDLLSAAVKIIPRLNAKTEYLWCLSKADGTEAASGTGTGEVSFVLQDPVLWNPEQPYLYRLTLTLGTEVIGIEIGFKRLEIKNSVFYFNAKKFKFRGINRHDTHPEKGYAVSVEDMYKDLYVLKKAHVNAIRTSHYPNDPRFLQLCSRLGFAVINEADLESHGMGYNYGDWYWDYWAYLCDAPEWKHACLDRMERLYERDKNNASVVMWSLGNESGCGENHRAMANYVRGRDKNAIIHYENARIDYGERLNKDFSDISDVESRMYAPLDYLKAYLADQSLTKPFFYCEYASAWSTGDIPLHWNEFEQSDKYMGGCIWEFADHAVNIGSPEQPKYRYGGDFNDLPNDGIYCVDGLVYPNRLPRPGFYDMLECYKPVAVTFENGVLTVKNKRFYSYLTEFYGEIEIQENGKTVSSRWLSLNSIAPLQSKRFVLPKININAPLVTLNFKLCYGIALPYAGKGEVAGQTQFILNKQAFEVSKNTEKAVSVTESRTEIRVAGKGFSYTFSKLYGCITSLKTDQELLGAPSEPVIFKAHLPNSSGAEFFKRARYIQAKQKTYRCCIVRQTEDQAVILISCSLAAPALPPALYCEMTYTIHGSGCMDISCEVKVTENAVPLPRFGIMLPLKSSFQNITYVGYGPYETYCDRYRSASLSEYQTTVKNNFEPHIKPTEGGAHYNTLRASVTDETGGGIELTAKTGEGFSFNASPFHAFLLHNTPHNDELVAENKTYVFADYKLYAENACNLEREPQRSFHETEFKFELTLKPLR